MIVFFVGPPGAGKTSLVRELLEKGSYFVTSPKWTVGKKVCAAGHYMGTTFDGADTVPYNGARACLEYWREGLYDRAVTIFDGDRFSNRGTIDYLVQHGFSPQLACVHVTVPPEVALERRFQRGSNQNATWVKGRVTKAANFAANFPYRRLELVATKPAPKLAALVRDWLKP